MTREEQQRSFVRDLAPKPLMEAAAFKATTIDRPKQGNRPRCSHCQKLGHEKNQCFELVGYPPNWGSRKTNRDNQQWKSGGSSNRGSENSGGTWRNIGEKDGGRTVGSQIGGELSKGTVFHAHEARFGTAGFNREGKSGGGVD